MRSGWSSGSIYSVLLVSGWFAVSKAIIPDAQEHFLTPSARRDTHPFGGLGLKTRKSREFAATDFFNKPLSLPLIQYLAVTGIDEAPINPAGSRIRNRETPISPGSGR